MKRVLVVGAGSIGAHHSRAWLDAGASVTVFDIQPEALARLDTQIFPSRYGISLTAAGGKLSADSNSHEEFDLAVIGTPPDSHLEALRVWGPKTSNIYLEKPLVPPTSFHLENLEEFLEKFKGRVFCGYNHRLSPAYLQLIRRLRNHSLDSHFSVNTFWKEDWSGVLKAHPWLPSTKASYLGYTLRGGGALSEHSHGLDLTVFLASSLGFNLNLDAVENWKLDPERDSDTCSRVRLSSNDGSGHWLVTTSSEPQELEKSLTVKLEKVQYRVKFSAELDALDVSNGGIQESFEWKKTRKDDFRRVVTHVNRQLDGFQEEDWLDLDSALQSQKLLIAAVETAKFEK